MLTSLMKLHNQIVVRFTVTISVMIYVIKFSDIEYGQWASLRSAPGEATPLSLPWQLLTNYREYSTIQEPDMQSADRENPSHFVEPERLSQRVHRGHYFPLSWTGIYTRFEVLTAVTMENIILSDVTPCSPL